MSSRAAGRTRVRSAKPAARQRVALDHLLWMQRNLYNASLAERRDAWRDDQRSISRYEQFASLNGMAQSNPASAATGCAWPGAPSPGWTWPSSRSTGAASGARHPATPASRGAGASTR